MTDNIDNNEGNEPGTDPDIPANNPLVQNELEALRKQADLLGIRYHTNIGVENLKLRIEEHMAGVAAEQTVDNSKLQKIANNIRAVPESKAEIATRKRKEGTRLVRIQLTCMNPNKKDYGGEYFTFSNSVIGTVRRYVPFYATDGWHVEQVILNLLRERKYQTFIKSKDKFGNTVNTPKLVNEFSIAEINPLSPQELKDLAQRQQVAAGVAV